MNDLQDYKTFLLTLTPNELTELCMQAEREVEALKTENERLKQLTEETDKFHFNEV